MAHRHHYTREDGTHVSFPCAQDDVVSTRKLASEDVRLVAKWAVTDRGVLAFLFFVRTWQG